MSFTSPAPSLGWYCRKQYSIKCYHPELDASRKLSPSRDRSRIARTEVQPVDPQPGQKVIIFFFHLLHLAPNVHNRVRWAWCPGIEWLLELRFKDESKNGGGVCRSVRYIAHLYCLAIQAGFYSEAVERWTFVRRVAGSIYSRGKR